MRSRIWNSQSKSERHGPGELDYAVAAPEEGEDKSCSSQANVAATSFSRELVRIQLAPRRRLDLQLSTPDCACLFVSEQDSTPSMHILSLWAVRARHYARSN